MHLVEKVGLVYPLIASILAKSTLISFLDITCIKNSTKLSKTHNWRTLHIISPPLISEELSYEEHDQLRSWHTPIYHK